MSKRCSRAPPGREKGEPVRRATGRQRELYGVRQGLAAWRGVPFEDSLTMWPGAGWERRGLYRFVRQPIFASMLAAIWCTPRMSVGRLFFALGSTGFIGGGHLAFRP
jgi:hypothetical protein